MVNSIRKPVVEARNKEVIEVAQKLHMKDLTQTFLRRVGKLKEREQELDGFFKECFPDQTNPFKSLNKEFSKIVGILSKPDNSELDRIIKELEEQYISNFKTLSDTSNRSKFKIFLL